MVFLSVFFWCATAAFAGFFIPKMSGGFQNPLTRDGFRNTLFQALFLVLVTGGAWKFAGLGFGVAVGGLYVFGYIVAGLWVLSERHQFRLRILAVTRRRSPRRDIIV